MSAALHDAESCPTQSLQQGQAEAAITALHALGNQVDSRTYAPRGSVTTGYPKSVQWQVLPREPLTPCTSPAGQASADVRAAYALDADVTPGTRGQR